MATWWQPHREPISPALRIWVSIPVSVESITIGALLMMPGSIAPPFPPRQYYRCINRYSQTQPLRRLHSACSKLLSGRTGSRSRHIVHRGHCGTQLPGEIDVFTRTRSTSTVKPITTAGRESNADTRFVSESSFRVQSRGEIHCDKLA
jgi:hypothetical protein